MQRRYSPRDMRKLFAFQDYLISRFPLTSYHVADISDYVKLRFLRPIRGKKKLRVWKTPKVTG